MDIMKPEAIHVAEPETEMMMISMMDSASGRCGNSAFAMKKQPV